MGTHRRYVSTYVEVEVDIKEFSDEQIMETIKERGLVVGGIEEAERLYDAVCEGRIDDAKLILERQLHPRWRDLQSCVDAFKAVRAS
jgi:hypothetical protein